MNNTVYLSLGSNLGDRVANIGHVIEHLRRLGTVNAVSDLFETEPVEVTDQPWFINCTIEMTTALAAQQLLEQLLDIERQMGRQRTRAKGPRVIDIDILLFGDTVIDTKELTIPHPSMHERRFVLEPLAEIAAKVRHPVLRKSIEQVRDALPPGPPVVRRFPDNDEFGRFGK